MPGRANHPGRFASPAVTGDALKRTTFPDEPLPPTASAPDGASSSALPPPATVDDDAPTPASAAAPPFASAVVALPMSPSRTRATSA